jgi:hypothetical protein
MSKHRLSYADALARLLFAKPLEELEPAERAELECCGLSMTTLLMRSGTRS